MRFVPRALAITTTAALAVAGLSVPAYAATSLTCLTSPINNTNRTMVAFSGTDTPLTVQTVTATSSGGGSVTPSSPVIAGRDGTFSGTLNTTSLGDGIVTITAVSGSGSAPLGSSDDCTANKETTPPPAATDVTFAPTAPINGAEQAAVAISAVAVDADVARVELTVSGGGTELPTTNPTRASDGTWTSTFDLSGFPDGTLNVRARTFDAFGNANEYNEAFVKNAAAPGQPTVETRDTTGGALITRVNAMTPTGNLRITGTSTTSTTPVDNLTHVVTVTDSAGTVRTPAVVQSGTANATYTAELDTDPLADGTLRIVVTPTDSFGNVGPSREVTLVKDTSVPAVTGLTIAPNPIGAAGDQSVVVSGTVVQNSGSLTPSESGTQVTVRIPGGPVVEDNPLTPADEGDDGVRQQSSTIAADGTFTFTFDLSGFADQTVTASAFAVDPRGNTSPTVPASAVKDTVAPIKPSTPITANATPSNVTAVSIDGTADAGTTVEARVTDSAGVVRTLPIFTTSGGSSTPNSGTWSGTFDATDLAEGTFTVTARATDAAGNVSVVSDAGSGQKDTVELAEVAKSPTGRAAPNTTVRVAFNEPLSPSSTLNVVTVPGNAPVAGATSFADGGQTIVFTRTGGTFADGTYRATYNVTESRPGADQLGPVSFDFLIDATAPPAPAINAFPVVNIATASAAPISGTGEPLATVTITVTDSTTSGPPLNTPQPVTRTKSVVVSPDGTWSTTIDTTGQAEGALTATATQTDTSGNTSGASAARSTTKDITRPTATVTAASDVTQAIGSTTVSGGGSDNGATFTTTISLGGVSRSGTGTTGAGGGYTTTIDATALPDGVVNVSTVVRDAAGNDSVAATRTFRKDTEGPFISGLAATNATVTSAGTTTVSGQTNDGTTTVTIVVSDGTTTVTATPTPAAMAPGVFSTDIDVSSLMEGPLTVSAVAKDSYGNSGEAARASATKDTIAPVVTGLAATATNVADSTSTVSGSIEPASTVAISVTVGGTTKTASATADVTGAFIAEVDLAGAPDGPVAVKATATDVIGNVGPEATTTTTRDATKPVVADLRSSDTNAAQTTTTVTGTTEPGASVLLSATSTGSAMPASRTVTADGSGAISTTLDLTSLNDGTITVTATPTDTAGNLGDAATATSTKDTGAPTLTMLNGSDVNAASTVTTVTGTVSEAGADIALSVTDGTTTVTRTLLDLSGTTFSTTLDLATLADKADITATATATDAGSNTGAAATDTLVKDTVAPTVTTLTATGTSSATPGSTVSGTGEAGTTIAVSITSPGSTTPVTGTATVQPDGTFSVVVDASSLQDGTLTVTATATDAVGNTGADKTATASKDATGPVVTTLAATATNAAQTVTTVTGTTEAGAVVTLVAASSGGPATVTDTVTAGSDGAFTKALEVKDLVDGTVTVTAVAKDARQNAGPAKTATAGKDTVAPALTGLGATGTTTATPRTTVTGTTDLSQSVTVTVTSGSSTATGSATGSATDGTFSVQVDLASFPEGPFTVAVSATDAAGNPATASTTASKDTTGPIVTELAATGTNASSAVSTVTGRAETGASVVVTATDGTRTVTKTVTAAAGAFSTTLDLTGFADGTVTTTARATDTGGNAGAVSSVTSTRDTAAPAVTELAATRTSTNQQVSTVTGKAETGSSVVVTATDGTRTATKTVTAAAGAFSTTLDLTGFADGTVTTTARATDSAGNQGATATVTSTRDTVAPTVTGLAATASTNATPGSTVTGTTEGGSSVALTATDSAGKTVTGTATAASGGGFSAVLDLSGLAQGTVTVTAVATDVAGNTGPSATATTSRSANALRFVALTSPVRAMDSRTGTGTSTGLKRGAVELDLTSRVPASATGAVLNVTVTQPETGGFVVVYPAGTTQPPTSNVNFAAGQTQANEVVTALASRKATVFVSGSGRAHLVVDVVGYFTADSGAGGFLTTLAPQRVLGSALARNVGSSSGSSSVDVDLSDALPAGATGAILNVTVASPSQPGFVVAYPTGTADPGTSNVNFAANQVQANEVITRVSIDGKVRLTLSRGQARLIVDVVGAIVPSTVAGAKRFTPLPTPVRALDTRSGLGTTGTSRRTSSSPVVLSLPSSVPSDAVGVVLNVTSTGQVGSGFVVAFPTGTAQPGTSNVNFRAGVNQANEVVVGLGTGSSAGKVTLAVGGGTGSPATHLIADVVGYLR